MTSGVPLPDCPDVEAGHDDGEKDDGGRDRAQDDEQGRGDRGEEDRLGGVSLGLQS